MVEWDKYSSYGSPFGIPGRDADSNSGDAARKTALQLMDRGWFNERNSTHSVDLLLLFDPVGKPWHVGPFGFEDVPTNVRKALHYHQRWDPRILGGLAVMQEYMPDSGAHVLRNKPAILQGIPSDQPALFPDPYTDTHGHTAILLDEVN